jgi:cytochrome b561
MSARPGFTRVARLLHWAMAAMILAMLFIGVGMVSTVSNRHDALVAIHRPLGIAILVLAAIRLVYRLTHPAPPLPAGMPTWQRGAAHLSHWALYGLMLALPLVGWAMLSAGAYPVVLYQALHLPAILPPDPMLYAALRRAHRLLAYLLFATFLAHLAAALLHGLVYRDGVFASMARGRSGRTLPRTG